MDAIFYKNNSDSKVLNKTLSYLFKLDIILKTASNLINPVIDVQIDFDYVALSDGVIDDNDDEIQFNDNDLAFDIQSSIIECNYVYIPVLKRYYYVKDIILVTDKLYRLTLDEDERMSLKENFLKLNAYVTRNENTYNQLINDNLANFKLNKEIEVIDATGIANKNLNAHGTYSIVMAYLTDSVDPTLVSASFPQGAYNNSTNYLVMNSATAKNMSELLYNDDTKRSFIKSFKIYPFEIDNIELSSKTSFKIGTETITVSSEFPVGEHYRKPQRIPDIIQISSFTYLGRENNPYKIDFLDYEPYSKYELFIPFHKWIELDANQVVNNRITIQYIIDYDSGKTFVKVQNYDGVIYESDVEFGMDIPLSTSNQREADDKSLSIGLNTGIGLIGSALSMASGNPFGVASGILSASKTISSAVTGVNTNYVKATGTVTNASNGYTNPLKPYLRIIRNIPVGYDENYFKLKGRPLYEVKKLSDLTGLTIIDDINLDYIDATEEEKIRLYSLLREGIII